MTKKKENPGTTQKLQSKIEQPKVELITMKNANENDKIIIAPSFDIIHALINLIGEKGLQGEIYKENDKLMIATGFEMSMELESFLKINQAFKLIKK